MPRFFVGIEFFVDISMFVDPSCFSRKDFSRINCRKKLNHSRVTNCSFLTEELPSWAYRPYRPLMELAVHVSSTDVLLVRLWVQIPPGEVLFSIIFLCLHLSLISVSFKQAPHGDAERFLVVPLKKAIPTTCKSCLFLASETIPQSVKSRY